MKQLAIILFVLLSFTLSYAQDGKPTKEETIKFISNYFSGYENVQFPYGSMEREYKYMWEGKRKETLERLIFNMKYTDFKLADCQMQFSQSSHTLSTKIGYSKEDDEYEKVYPHTDGITKTLLDFNKIESIKVLYEKPIIQNPKGEDIPSDFRYVSFFFTILKEDGKYDSYRLQLGKLENNIEGESLKIYKAFQHLRKLCGAPEPISFD